MNENQQRSSPSGRPPWDPWNGARVGGFAGGLVGVVIAVLMSNTAFWLVPVGALFGAALGYRSEKRKQTMEPRTATSDPESRADTPNLD